MVADREEATIIALIRGDDSCHVLPLLDVDLIDSPIVADTDFGHTQAVTTQPTGREAELGPAMLRFSLVEHAVVQRD